jgi:hypothetical protein
MKKMKFNLKIFLIDKNSFFLKAQVPEFRKQARIMVMPPI